MAESEPKMKRLKSPAAGARTLAVDIGGTGTKVEILNAAGKSISDRIRVPTPQPATPRALVKVIRKLAKAAGAFDRVSVGFPGVVKNGCIYTAPNLGNGWKNVMLDKLLERKLGKPVRVANDADIQGLGSVTGRGIELVITLGTGFGSVIFSDGNRIHLELGHAPFHKGKTYEEELGIRALKKKGKRKWNKLLREAIDDLAIAFNYDRLYIGGGNTRYIKFDLPESVKLVSNLEGLLGGIKLWEVGEGPGSPVARKSAAASQVKRGRRRASTKPAIEMRPTTNGPAPLA
ncbi:MAG TPA: ROK family protein [Candidatus Binataceae bacterium]|nr:ROK family protein [Candidatus Binataceae bacterium]